MKKKGFTLIELLAVIVVLAIILAIAIPTINNFIKESRKNTFNSDIKILIKAIENKRLRDTKYDVINLSVDSMEEDLGLGNKNYESIEASIVDGNVYIEIVGQNVWEGLTATGTLDNLVIAEEAAPAPIVPGERRLADEECYTFDETTGTISGYDFSNEQCPLDLIISSTISGTDVQHIGAMAFTYPITITRCMIFDERGPRLEFIKGSYTRVDGDGYVECDQPDAGYGGDLTSVYIPENIITIGEGALAFNELTDVEFAEESLLQSIDEAAFVANKLTSIHIPNSVTNLGDLAFYNNKITDCTLSSNMTIIPYALFWNNELTSVTIPNSVTGITNLAFTGNRITNITIPNSVTFIDDNVFSFNLLTNVTIPGSVETIGFAAFRANRITNLVLSNGIIDIGSEAFTMNQLTTVAIPNSVTTIYDNAFYNDTLTSVTIDNTEGLVTVDPTAFGGVTPVYLR